MAEFSKQALILSVVLLVMFWLSGLPSQFRHIAASQPIELISDLIYYEGPGFSSAKHRLDIYRPMDINEAPVFIFVHGGSWTISDKSSYRYVGEAFASRGILTVVISYRLSPAIKHPEHVKDVARAFRWVYEHVAQLGGDREKIFVGGHSAGAHLSALLALDNQYLVSEGLSNQNIRGVINLSGVYDLNQILGFTNIFSADFGVRANASPITFVTDSEPPFLIIYAETELSTLANQAVKMKTRLEELGNKVTLQKILRSAHLKLIWDIGAPNDPTTDMITNFINENSNVSSE